MSDVLCWDDDIPTRRCRNREPHDDHYWRDQTRYCPGVKP